MMKKKPKTFGGINAGRMAVEGSPTATVNPTEEDLSWMDRQENRCDCPTCRHTV